jgi:Outer membrane protein beta-barrel domain
MKRAVLLTSCALLMVLTAAAQGQTPIREFSLAIGASQYDASGTGTAPLGAFRYSAPIAGRWLVGDLSLSYATLDEQFSSTNTNLGVAEGQLQAQLPFNSIRPYIGVGGGWLHYFSNMAGRPATGGTVSGSVGLRIPVSNALILRGEMRLRAWQAGGDGAYHDNAAEYTAGLGFAF